MLKFRDESLKEIENKVAILDFIHVGFVCNFFFYVDFIQNLDFIHEIST